MIVVLFTCWHYRRQVPPCSPRGVQCARLALVVELAAGGVVFEHLWVLASKSQAAGAKRAHARCGPAP